MIDKIIAAVGFHLCFSLYDSAIKYDNIGTEMIIGNNNGKSNLTFGPGGLIDTEREP